MRYFISAPTDIWVVWGLWEKMEGLCRLHDLVQVCLFCPGKEVADRWYSEIKNYNFQQPGFTSGTGEWQWRLG